MPRHRFTPQQIAAKLEAAQRLEAQRVPVAEVCRQLGVAELTYLRWCKKFAALDAGAAARVRRLEEENARLRRAVEGLGQVLEELKDEIEPPRLHGTRSR